MRTIEVDARRYAWCRGQALWRLGLPIAALLEDMRGAVSEQQDGLARHAGRAIGQNCAVVLTLALYFERPLPPPRVRTSWALARLGDHPLAEECESLVRGDLEADAAGLLARAELLVSSVHELVGEVPDPLTPDGYFPAISATREWLELLQAVGEDNFLPREWTNGR